jgi:hypothetical protein
MKAYHGTNSKFKNFEDSFQQGVDYGFGFYFTEDQFEARSYLKDANGYLLTVKLSLKNPFNVADKSSINLLIKTLGLKLKNVANNEGHMSPGSGLTEIDRDNYYHKIVSELFDNKLGISFYELKSELREVLESLGFDSIYDAKKKWWIAFNANQIEILESTNVRY